MEKGTYEALDIILAALFRDTFFSEFAIGERHLTVRRLTDHLLLHLAKPFENPANKKRNCNLDYYIEAQVHGDISLENDIEILVADPSFKDSHVGKTLEQICLRYSIELYWHMGFGLSVDEVPIDFRGPSVPSLARRIAQNDVVDTSMIGVAAMDLRRDPRAWSGRGTYQDVLQGLKLLWHVLVRYGKPLREVR